MTSVVHGHADARFDKVADALADELSTGAEVSAAIAVDTDGELAKLLDFPLMTDILLRRRRNAGMKVTPPVTSASHAA